jgi:8-oxo-dGTP diphosphatase
MSREGIRPQRKTEAEFPRAGGARAIVLDGDGRLLLVKHSHKKTGHKYWTLPGGGALRGEVLAHCAVRETMEETGLEVEVERLVYLGDEVDASDAGRLVTPYFLCRITGGALRTGSDPDVAPDQQYLVDARLFTREEVAALPEVYPLVLRDEFWESLGSGFMDHDPYRVYPF